MRIVHVCTMDTGGAAVAAQRLHDGLLKEGVDSSFLFLHISNANQYPNKHKFNHKPKHESIARRIKRKLGFAVSQKDKNRVMMRGLHGSYEAFSFPFTDYRVEDHPLIQNADIVNLHWVSDFVHYPTFFKNVKKPIVWTLHDMNPLLGGFHYWGDWERNKTVFETLEESLKRRKASAFGEAVSITIVTPSKWLGNSLHLNEVFSRKGYKHIPYGLDLSVFKPHDKKFARSVFNLPLDKKIILFVSENIHNYRKGFDLVVEAMKGVAFGDDAVIVTIGAGGNEPVQPLHLIPLGRVSDDRLMSLLYAAADIFVLPSREDNFPNVMLEAMACGTPVMAFNTGGMGEVIVNERNGILIEDVSAEGLREAIVDFIGDRFAFDRLQIRDFAIKNFDKRIQAVRYVEIYNKLSKGQPV